jgi:hypothetical protein
MATTQKPCYLQYFQTLVQVGTSSAPMLVNPSHIATAKTLSRDRPFLPLYGIKQISPGFFEPVAIASNKTNIPAVFRALATALYNASKKDANPTFVSLATFTSDKRFNQYLYNRIGDDATRLNRYYDSFERIVDFWNNLDGAATAQQYQDQLNKLRDMVLTQCDKELYGAPGDYFFDGDAFGVAFAAWLAADATLVGIAGIELNSI